MVTSGEVGSLLVWLDGDDVVIYDTHVRDVVDRVPLNGCGLANPITPLEDAVYWTEYDDCTATEERWPTGSLRPVDRDPDSLRRGRTTGPRRGPRSPILVVGSADSTNPAEDFTVVDSQLGSIPQSGAPPPVFVAATGERLRVSVPDGYDGESLGVFQWLDDDRFALVAKAVSKGTDRRPARVPHLRRPVPHRRLRRAVLAAARAFGGVGAEG